MTSIPKTCTRCGESKPATTEFYYAAATGKDGLYGDCKECRRAAGEAYRRKRFGEKLTRDFSSPDKTCTVCQKVKPRDADHFSRKAKAQDGLQPRCKDCQQQLRRKHYLANQEEERAYTRAHAAANPFARRLRRLVNPEKYRQKDRAYDAANPEARAVSNHNHRAKKLGVQGRIKTQQLRDLKVTQGGCCAYCQRPLTASLRPNADHVIPISRPELSPTGSIENFAWACWACNRDKWSRTPAEWTDRWYEHKELREFIENQDKEMN